MRHTLRLRLALMYSGVFFASGILLLGIVVGLFTARSTVQTAPLPGPSTPGGAHIADSQHGSDLEALVIASVAALCVMVLVAVVLGWVVAGRALSPLRSMLATARAISSDNLHSRIGLDSPYSEFKELGLTLNDLFSRLEAAFQSQRHFIANASHELRTPLTAERALLQVTLADPDATIDDLRATCRQLLTLGADQERLIDSLLTLAASQPDVELWEPLDLDTITADVIRTREPQARQRDVQLHTTLSKAPTAGDPRLVESLVANLIDNAIRHNIPSGRIDVTVSAGDQGSSAITVRNTGTVISSDDVDRLFAPFQRLHTERTRHADGHGLGLAIVQAITTAHGGLLTATAPRSGGLNIRITFPPTSTV